MIDETHRRQGNERQGDDRTKLCRRQRTAVSCRNVAAAHLEDGLQHHQLVHPGSSCEGG